MRASRPVLTPAAAPGDERGRGEAGDQAEDAKGQDPAGIAVTRIADAAQREDEGADAEERRGDAEHAIEGLHALGWPPWLLLHVRRLLCHGLRHTRGLRLVHRFVYGLVERSLFLRRQSDVLWESHVVPPLSHQVLPRFLLPIALLALARPWHRPWEELGPMQIPGRPHIRGRHLLIRSPLCMLTQHKHLVVGQLPIQGERVQFGEGILCPAYAAAVAHSFLRSYCLSRHLTRR